MTVKKNSATITVYRFQRKENMVPKDDHGQPPVTFSLDGTQHTSTDRRMPASAVLSTFGGLDPADYDLLRITGHGEEHRYQDTDEVELVPGGRYVSLFTGSMPVE